MEIRFIDNDGIVELVDVIDLGWGGAHSDRSPSAAERWMTCPGSVLLSKQFEDTTSIYAAEGTAAHYVREQCLNDPSLNVEDFVGRVIHTEGYYFSVLEEWVGYLQPTIDWAREISRGKDCEMVVEMRVSLAPWLPKDSGTLDLGIITPTMIYINDEKFGAGLLVEAERNKQQMLYALGFWQQYARHRTKATTFRLMIDQPRAADGTGSHWDVELEELLAFGEEARAAAELTFDPDAPLQVSAKGCHWCKVFDNMACPAVHDFVQEAAGLNPDLPYVRGNVVMPEIEKLTVERRLFLFKNWPVISKYGRLLKQSLTEDAMTGAPVPGYKAVATEGDRSWVSEEAVQEFFKGRISDKELFNKQLKSPAQVEKIAGTRTWNQVQALIVRPEGPPALVPESDKRPALTNFLDMLDDLEDDDLVALLPDDDDLLGDTLDADSLI